jgi:Tol biopolymer transport system component
MLFDKSFKALATLPLEGVPSRARVSADSQWAATTTFVSGDSYAAASFSTRTVIYDLSTNKAVANLEDFAVTKDGNRIESIDFNFWGVTFAKDGDTFYATLGTGGKQYLVKGSIAGRSVVVLRDGVECPSLSPDGTRIAFKSRQNGIPVKWQLSVLDLETLVDHPIADTRSVDDQVEWLDDETLIYGLPEAGSGTAASNTWVVPADGTGRSTLFTTETWSTVVVPAEAA